MTSSADHKGFASLGGHEDRPLGLVAGRCEVCECADVVHRDVVCFSDEVLKIASRRLQQHNSGEELGPLDCRIEAICGMTKGLNHYWPRPLVICRILPVCAAAHAGKDSYEPLSYVEKLLI